MKRCIIVFMSLLCFIPALAQDEFESLLSESKVWTMMIKPTLNPNVYGDLRYIKEMKLVGDTVINGIHFMRKYERQCILGEEMPTAWSATNEYLGQDECKIYQYSNWTKNMILDMDLSLKIGDKVSYYNLLDIYDDHEVLFDLVVTAVSDTILNSSTDQVRRRCMYVQVEDTPSITDVWIEGIGSMQNGISGVYLTLATGAFVNMTECIDGDTVLYQSEPLLDIQDVRSYKSDGYSIIYDLLGRRLSEKPQKGLYIQNGKKRIVK